MFVAQTSPLEDTIHVQIADLRQTHSVFYFGPNISTAGWSVIFDYLGLARDFLKRSSEHRPDAVHREAYIYIAWHSIVYMQILIVGRTGRTKTENRSGIARSGAERSTAEMASTARQSRAEQSRASESESGRHIGGQRQRHRQWHRQWQWLSWTCVCVRCGCSAGHSTPSLRVSGNLHSDSTWACNKLQKQCTRLSTRYLSHFPRRETSELTRAIR